MRLRMPLVGPEYSGSKWGPPPKGSAVAMGTMWHTLVMRTNANQNDRDWCKEVYLLGGTQPYFPDSITCLQMLEALGTHGRRRYNRSIESVDDSYEP